MTAASRPSPQAIKEAGEVYGAVLADPERADQIRQARERYRASQPPAAANPPGAAAGGSPGARRKAAQSTGGLRDRGTKTA